MGIPSFYRHLLITYPALVTRGAGPHSEWLCLDFNCAMYNALHKMPPFAEARSQDAWEEQLCRSIATYLHEIVALATPTKGVYVSCDGVVCAAKRRQQRLRRFKSPWTAAAEAEIKAAASGDVRRSVATPPCWDQNALTPGTEFMARLGATLTAKGAELAHTYGIRVQVSTTAEPGEGEHKLLAAMRIERPATCTIYGLDADLILLAMLLRVDTGAEVRLLREAQEFEGARAEYDGPGEWRNLSVHGLMDVLLPGADDRNNRVRDYVAAMSLLGNDFLPRSLTHTVRDDGIPHLISVLQYVWTVAGQNIVNPMTGSLSRAGLLTLITHWEATEELDMTRVACDAVLAASRRSSGGRSPVERELRHWQNQPTRWCSVGKLLDNTKARTLLPGWRSVYNDQWEAGSAENYLAGVAWVWDYYSGKAVDQGWYFAEHLPPLWSAVAATLRAQKEIDVSPPPIVWAEPVPAWLHLLSVLPAASVKHLLPVAKHELMVKNSWWWPTEWSLFDVGRGQIWECEPVIPIIPEAVLRTWMSER